MKYTKISPLGNRTGPGTYDAIWNNKEYNSLEEAEEKGKLVVLDFVKDENNTVYFEIYNSDNPEEKKYHRLNYQHFPFGVDALDDGLAIEIAETLI